jgi:tRNA threonylcarbamoyladenosine biosynthesis protein TsaB
MIVLTLRSDKPEAEVGLFEDNHQLAYIKWPAHLELSKTINTKIKELLDKSSKQASDIGGIVGFAGPGSFTGLRIGLSVANALAYAYDIPIVSASDEDWVKSGIRALAAGKNDKIITPIYDRPAATTPPKK